MVYRGVFREDFLPVEVYDKVIETLYPYRFKKVLDDKVLYDHLLAGSRLPVYAVGTINFSRILLKRTLTGYIECGLQQITLDYKEGSKMVIGYTTGVYDLFHIGHLNLLKNAKGMCDKLIVGVTVDELVQYKGKNAMIPFEDRIEIVRSIKYVDAAVPQYNMDKLRACKELGATMLFVGDDWYGTEKWKKFEEEFKTEGIKIVYFPYTRGISSTKISEALTHVRGWSKDVEPIITTESEDEIK